MGVVIFAFGIGRDVQVDELKIIATDENHVFLENEFQQMVIKINQNAKMICKSKILKTNFDN